MALINFYKGLESDYDSSLHNNSIYQCTDSGVVYILGIKHEKISKEEIDNIVGSNTYTDANYISKETNLTDAALQLDEEIKATNDNLAILNAATVKSVKVGSNTSNEAFSNGVITIANATTSTDGALSKEDKTKLDNIESTYLPLTGGTMTGAIVFDSDVIGPITFDGNNILYALNDQMFFGTQNKELILRTSNHAIGVVRNSNTYYLWDSYNLDPKIWHITEQTEDYNLTDKNGITYYRSADIANSPGGSYGVVTTIGDLNSGNIGTTNTFGFQLGKSNDSGYLKYREFIGLTIGSWKELATVDDNKTLIIAESASANSTNALAYTRIKNGNYNVAWRDSATQIYIANSISTLESSIEFNYTMFETTGYTQYKVTLLENGTCTKSIYASFTIPTVQTVSEFPTELDNYADGSIFIKE